MKRAPRSVPFALVLIALSCGSREEPVSVSSEGIDAPREGKTPIEVMENYALAHRTRNIEFYQGLIDPRFEIRMPPGHEPSNEGVATEDTFSVIDDSVLFVLVPDERKTPPTWRIICQQLFPVSGGRTIKPVE